MNLATVINNISEKTLSSEQLVANAIKTIKTKNPTIKAFSDTYFDDAMEMARACDLDAKKDVWRGPLHGVPVGVKDLLYTQGRRTTRGSAVFENFIPSENAVIVDRVEAAGAILIGKTTTTELGWSGSSVSEFYGSTRNPWNTELTSGGSSSGSAAAVASNMVPFALGSDGGGSVRIPAAFCGVFSMKGSLGRIPVYPSSATEMLSHVSPLTKTATDSAILFDLLKGSDARDHLSLPDDGLDYIRQEVDFANIKVAYAPTLFGEDVDNEVAAAVQGGVARIQECLGIKVKTIELDWKDPIKVFETLWVAGRGLAFSTDRLGQEAGLGEGFRNLVNASRKYSIGDYLDAMSARAIFASKVHKFFEQFDILLLPTVPILPFGADLEAPNGMRVRSEVLPWTAWTPFTYPFNLSGNPAASIAAGLSKNGLPIGLQVVGKRYSDGQVLAFCRALEEKASFKTLDVEQHNATGRTPEFQV